MAHTTYPAAGQTHTSGRHTVAMNVDQYTSAPLRIEKSARLNVSPEVVFAKVGNHEGLTEWIPMVASVDVDYDHSETPGENGVGTVRTCAFGPDTLNEAIRYWDPPHAYIYQITSEDIPMVEHLGVFSVEPDGEGGSLFTWRQYFTMKPSIKGFVMPYMVRMVMNRALKNLIREFGGGRV